MFLWLDCETTGTEELTNSILEVAVVLTDDKLNELERYESVIFASPEILAQMNDWSRKQHQKSGLIEECVKSSTLVSDVDDKLCDLIKRHDSGAEQLIIAGSSIHFDRKFIKLYLPKTDKKLHYRMLDVSGYTIGLSAVLGITFSVEKDSEHRAMPDIADSLSLFKRILTRFK